MNVIAIFDIGKTNKKFFLLNEQYSIVHEQNIRFGELADEDGFPCDDLQQLSQWVVQTINDICLREEFTIAAINFSAYGASFVHIDEKGAAVMPLYNYLKPYPPQLKDRFYDTYGSEEEIAVTTASPVLGNLNSGLQLYLLKYSKTNWYQRVQYSLHLPQYISWLITHKPYSEITSIGCHTALWDIAKNGYHNWVFAERINEKLPPLWASTSVSEVTLNGKTIKVGVGLHDSSAALIPYLSCFSEPFILLSTGTWCISLNPFNQDPLTAEELEQDCLCYMQYTGRQVKASRVFAGNEHAQQVKRLADHFNVPADHYEQVMFDPDLLNRIDTSSNDEIRGGIHPSAFAQRDIKVMGSFEIAYHQLLYDLICQQKFSTSLIFSASTPVRIYVDGGFARNEVYMHLLAAAFPAIGVYASTVSQATAMGAALAIHDSWNRQPVPGDMVQLKYYTVTGKS